MDSLIKFIKDLPCISVQTSSRIVQMLECMEFTPSEKMDIEKGMQELQEDVGARMELVEDVAYEKGRRDGYDTGYEHGCQTKSQIIKRSKKNG